MAFLIVYQDNQEVSRYKIEKVLTTLGRAPTCDLSLTCPLISQTHAHLLFKDNQYFLTDLASTNGTFVNGKRIKKIVLQDKDEVKIGSFVLKFYLQPLFQFGETLSNSDQLAMVREELARIKKDFPSEIKKGGLVPRIKMIETVLGEIEKNVLNSERLLKNLKREKEFLQKQVEESEEELIAASPEMQALLKEVEKVKDMEVGF